MPPKALYFEDILADFETPLSAYWKLASEAQYSFLLESVTGGEQLARYSIIGLNPNKVISSKGQVVFVSGKETALPPGKDILHLVNEELANYQCAGAPGLPNFTGGAVGFLAYDFVRFLEKIPDTCKDDIGLDDGCFMFFDTTVVFDHARNLIKVVALDEPTDAGKQAAQTRIASVVAQLSNPLPPLPAGNFPAPTVESNMSQAEYEAAVTKVKGYLAAGDGQQMVPSQRFSCENQAHPLTIYRALRSLNPSPYMFLLRLNGTALVGASPEILVSLHGRKARLRPIAGTRWRGATPEIDNDLAAELLHDEKERAEHVMLVDLGRNDLGRVCEFGSVTVNDLMVIERYSHVMHIVSDVTGELRPELNAADLIRACFPAGTVSGSPKVRAMQIIDELEPTRRGLYAGSVGFLGASGDTDMCIAIRTILLKDGKAYVQAGGGVVFDSDPTFEYNESRNKAKACLRAIEMAHEGLG